MCDFGHAFLLVMLGDITDQPWNISVVTTQRFISHSQVILRPWSQEHPEERGKSGGDGIIERFSGNLAKIHLGKYKESEVLSSFCGSDPGMWREEISLFLCVHPTGRVCTLKQREQITVGDVLYCLDGDQLAQSKEYKPWGPTHLGLPLATSLALGKLLNPCKILATVCKLQIILAPTS